LLSSLRRRAFVAHLGTVGLMVLASPAMVLAVQRGSAAGFWAALGAFISANLLECLIP
jgi:hypothetical protein